jgi:hypothetical protein
LSTRRLSLSLSPPPSIPVHVQSSQTRPNSHRLLAMQNLPPTSGKVVITTNIGDIDVELWTKEAPLACRNFVQLCMEVGSDPSCTPPEREAFPPAPPSAKARPRPTLCRWGARSVLMHQFFFPASEKMRVPHVHPHRHPRVRIPAAALTPNSKPSKPSPYPDSPPPL